MCSTSINILLFIYKNHRSHLRPFLHGLNKPSKPSSPLSPDCFVNCSSENGGVPLSWSMHSLENLCHFTPSNPSGTFHCPQGGIRAAGHGTQVVWNPGQPVPFPFPPLILCCHDSELCTCSGYCTDLPPWPWLYRESHAPLPTCSFSPFTSQLLFHLLQDVVPGFTPLHS